MKKKTVFALLIVIILFDFIFSNYAYASDPGDSDATDEISNTTPTLSEGEFSNLESGTVTLGGSDTEVSTSTSSAAGSVNLFISLGMAVASPVLGLMTMIANSGGLYYIESDYSAANVGWFTICSLVFGEYLMFNADILQTNKDLNPDIEPTTVSNIIDTLKDTVLAIYQVVRMAGLILMGIMLFYTCAKLLIANATTTESDSASNQKLAVLKKTRDAWVVGFVFLLLLPIFIVLFNNIYSVVMDMLYSIRTTIEASGNAGFESVLFKEALTGVVNYSGFVAFVYALELILFTILDVKFFIKYLKRLIIVLCLILLAPIVCVLDIYAKLRNKPGRMIEWVKIYLENMLLQPMHAFIYLVFLFMGSNIAVTAPLIGIILLYALDLSEKVFNMMLDLGKARLGNMFGK